jgi:serine/threonine protein kinase
VIFEYVPGDSLYSILKAGITLTFPQQLIIAYGVARGVEHLGQRAQLFLDLNSRSVILNADFEPTIVRLGFYRYLSYPLKGGHQFPTPAYDQPNRQQRPFSTVMKTVDQYAFGALLWVMVQGWEPSDGKSWEPELSVAVADGPDHPFCEIIRGLIVQRDQSKMPMEKVCAKLAEIGQAMCPEEFGRYREKIDDLVQRESWPEAGAVGNWSGLMVDVTPTLGIVGANLFRRLGQPKVAMSYAQAAAAFGATQEIFDKYMDLKDELGASEDSEYWDLFED